jgi:predicted GIY-YIG superfamily endonuclease
MTVYLIHFSRRLKHAQHYLGKTADLRQRVKDHASGCGAKILAACNRKGIKWRVVRVWRGADKKLERRLKSHHRAELCPSCSGRAAMARGRK